MVLFAAESYYVHRAGERAIDLACAVVECNPHRVRILLIFVDQHQRPLTVGSLYCIGGHQRVSGRVVDIDVRWEYRVFAASWLHPFQVNELTGEVLRSGLQNLILTVNCKHRKRAQ